VGDNLSESGANTCDNLPADNVPPEMTPEERFLAACWRRPVDRTPVWFMRQAGRSLPEYRAMRERHAMLDMARSPELATEVTLMPVGRLGVDGAVIFSDIMIPIEGMGVEVEIEPEVGPIINTPVSCDADVDRMVVRDPRESTPYVLETIRLVREELAGGKAAVIAFCGSPFTLACYLVEGRPSRDYVKVKSLMMGQPATWGRLMDRLTDQMASYLLAQIDAGASVVQVFDSWVGALSPGDFERSVLPWLRRLFAAVNVRGVPSIYFGTGNASLLGLTASAGSTVVSVDWRVDIDDAWSSVGLDRGIQGNIDPIRVVAGWESTRCAADDVLRRVGGRDGHIFNLGHGVLPQSDPDVLHRLVDHVHAVSSRR
jgi:uroporphyrinogen decarboxylase